MALTTDGVITLVGVLLSVPPAAVLLWKLLRACLRRPRHEENDCDPDAESLIPLEQAPNEGARSAPSPFTVSIHLGQVSRDPTQ
ncbi:hypothetical protein LMH87_011866 [Akanthomyces muscarius]|uniref:Uncharacterized protein n=1 Tax=Akanthomyces muscarius TaxID=2231603 RepID=A0A9W8QAL8_AKAMU|nr:hypothetical protein LMH87_011866 [Akanthomyces muscarius]KAJ4151151.1 hypothetical protein LMH87_011866 [Akanthomyces muscarius]